MGKQMTHPTGESKSAVSHVDFDRRLKLELNSMVPGSRLAPDGWPTRSMTMPAILPSFSPPSW